MDFTQAPVAPGTPFPIPTPTDTPALDPNEMRITFMGSCIPPVRRAQAMMSIFVEMGWVQDPVTKKWRAGDQVIFDCGSGSTRNYGAMGVGFGRMDKIFINHLHADTGDAVYSNWKATDGGAAEATVSGERPSAARSDGETVQHGGLLPEPMSLGIRTCRHDHGDAGGRFRYRNYGRRRSGF